MAYENLKTAIKQAIKQNGNQEITGNLLQSTLLNIVNTLGADYKFLGFATPSTVPPTSEEGNLFYFAIKPGNYSNFKTNTGNLVITIENGVFFFTKNATDSYWNSNKVFEIVQAIGEAEDKVMSQKATSTAIEAVKNRAEAVEKAVIFDVSAYNNGAVFESLSALLSASNLSTLIPTEVRCGGMTIRFIQSSDNKYVQYLLKTNSWSTNPDFWERYNDVIATDNQTNSDLDFSDEQGNILTRFSEGHIKTKYFDSSKDASEEERGLMSAEDKTKLNTIEEGADVSGVVIKNTDKGDLDFSDEQGNVVLRIKDGHIFSAKFSSDSITGENTVENTVENRTKNCRTLFSLDLKNIDQSVVMNGWNVSNGSITNGTNVGQSYPLRIEKDTAILERQTIYDFSFPELGAKIVCGYSTSGADANCSYVYFDTKNNVYGYKTNSSEVSKGNISLQATKKYRLIIAKNGRNSKCTLYDFNTLTQLCSFDTVSYNFRDYVTVWSESKSVRIYNVQIIIPHCSENIKCIIYGDSITEGLYASSEEKSWSNLIRDALGKDNCCVSGRCTCKIQHVSRRIAFECAILKPKYIMVHIGTNGGNTVDNITKLIEQIKNLGAIPIINTIICTATSTQSSVNTIIRQALNTYSNETILSADCQAATCKNFNVADGVNRACFSNDGGTTILHEGYHPSDYGHELMFKQVVKDIPQLFSH